MAGVWNLGFQECSQCSLTDKCRSLCLIVYANNVIYAKHLGISSGCLEFWHKLGKGCLTDQYPVQTLGTESLMGFPGQKHHTHTYVAAFFLWKEGEGENIKKYAVGTPPDSAYVFPLIIYLGVYFYYITVINLSVSTTTYWVPWVLLTIGCLETPDTTPTVNFLALIIYWGNWVKGTPGPLCTFELYSYIFTTVYLNYFKIWS